MRNTALILIALFTLTSCSDIDSDSPITRQIELESVGSATEIGRYIFYDKTISLNNSVSCASCHKQQFSFADNTASSLGFHHGNSDRNTPSIVNVTGGSIPIDGSTIPTTGFFIPDLNTNRRFVGSLFWDGRESNLQDMVLQPIFNQKEMGLDGVDDLIDRLESNPFYERSFKNVYGSFNGGIRSQNISHALSSFVSSIQSDNSKLDKFFQGRAALNVLESQGLNLFIEKYECNQCHQVQSPDGYRSAEGGSFANIGLERNYPDSGLQGTTDSPQDAGEFKIPSLRNLAHTAPYMHDGRFETLEEVIDHYSKGMVSHNNLDDRLKDDEGNPLILEISEQEKRAIVAFLNTLTDSDILTDPDLSDPFTYK